MTAILVVEDDDLLCQAMVGLFRRCGYTVHSAYSGNHAREILASNPDIGLILSDYYMPDGTGQSLLEHVKSMPVVRPFFILMTGQTDLTSKEIEELGADELLRKPFPIKELVTVVSRALGSIPQPLD
jgi:CheY-like chemotaxis protein